MITITTGNIKGEESQKAVDAFFLLERLASVQVSKKYHIIVLQQIQMRSSLLFRGSDINVILN